MKTFQRTERHKKRFNWKPFVLGLLLVWGLGFFATATSDVLPDDVEFASQIQTITQYNFIREIAPFAQIAQRNYHILPSITLAQACLESNFGQSLLASKYHNLFGIKAYGDVPTINLDTQEYENNQWITISGQFRVYPNDEQSVMGHSRLIANGTTWNPDQYVTVLAATDYKVAANALQTSGYATDPGYANKLIQMIQTYHLDAYDH
jgi:mannosyl-glycoprotein endo-beta-N-acetylglucosaminidase